MGQMSWYLFFIVINWSILVIAMQPIMAPRNLGRFQKTTDYLSSKKSESLGAVPDGCSTKTVNALLQLIRKKDISAVRCFLENIELDDLGPILCQAQKLQVRELLPYLAYAIMSKISEPRMLNKLLMNEHIYKSFCTLFNDQARACLIENLNFLSCTLPINVFNSVTDKCCIMPLVNKGQLYLCKEADNHITVTRYATNEQILSINSNDNVIEFAMSPDGAYVVACLASYGAQLISLGAHSLADKSSIMLVPEKNVSGAIFSTDSTKLFIGEQSGLTIYALTSYPNPMATDGYTWSLLQRLDNALNEFSFNLDFSALAVSNDGMYLAMGGASHRLALWSIQENTMLAEHDLLAHEIKFCTTNNNFFVVQTNKVYLMTFDNSAKKFKELQIFYPPMVPGSTINFYKNANDEFLIAVSDGNAYRWEPNADSGQYNNFVEHFESWDRALHYILTTSEDKFFIETREKNEDLQRLLVWEKADIARYIKKLTFEQILVALAFQASMQKGRVSFADLLHAPQVQAWYGQLLDIVQSNNSLINYYRQALVPIGLGEFTFNKKEKPD